VRAAALSLLVSFVLIPLSAVGVSADGNNGNQGNQYGQITQQGSHPAAQLEQSGQHDDTPIAPPTAAPAPTTQPPASQPLEAAPVAPTGTSASALNSGAVATTSEAPPLELKPVLSHSGDVNMAKAVPERDQELWWLLLILAATLAVLWLFAFVQLARSSMKRRSGGGAA
jgi:hypothetical protein